SAASGSRCSTLLATRRARCASSTWTPDASIAATRSSPARSAAWTCRAARPRRWSRRSTACAGPTTPARACRAPDRRPGSGGSGHGWSGSRARADYRPDGRSAVPGASERLADVLEGEMRSEPELLVEVQRARRVLGVDAERRDGHAAVAMDPQGANDQRTGKAAGPPGTANRDVVEPAHVDPERRVLVGVDGVHDDPGDLFAGPR